MTLNRPMYMQPAGADAAITYTAAQDRAGLIKSIFSREGVLDTVAGQLLVTQRAAGANFSVDVAAGKCAIDGDDISDQGTYVCTSTTTVNVTTPSAPGSGTRNHRVIARVKDKLSNGAWSTYEWTIELLQDTGSGTPATPASAISLAIVQIASGQASVTNAKITDTRPRASVGTPARTGSFSLRTDYTATDPGRPPTWHVNDDGWVSLAGWCRWTVGDFAISANTQYQISLGALPAPILPTNLGYRDFAGIGSFGAVQFSVDPSGLLTWLVKTGFTLQQNVTWWSFDGCGYRL